MASTRNRNSPGNYSLEISENTAREKYQTRHVSVGEVCMPGPGLLGLSCPSHLLSRNATDIESYLRGIGSTNLVHPQSPVEPALNTRPTLSIVPPIKPLILPEMLHMTPLQRPSWGSLPR